MTFGRVKKWMDERGFGFLERDDGQADVFFHIREFDGENPRVGEKVSFQMGERNGRACAVDIRRMGGAANEAFNDQPRTKTPWWES